MIFYFMRHPTTNSKKPETYHYYDEREKIFLYDE